MVQNSWEAEEATFNAKLTAALGAYDWVGNGFAGPPTVIHEAEAVDQDPGSLYVVIHVRPGAGKQISLGDQGAHRYTGVVILWVCVPDQQGTGLAKKIIGVLDDAFRAKQFAAGAGNTVTTYTPYVIPQGVKKGTLRFDITIPYKRDRFS